MASIHWNKKIVCSGKCQQANRKWVQILAFLLCFIAVVGACWFFNINPLHSKVNLDNLDESLKGQLIEGLLKLSDIVAERSKPSLGDTSKVYDIESYIEINKLLLKLRHAGIEPSSVQSKPAYEGSFVNPDICQEKYAYNKLNGDYPYFYKGFNIVNCTEAPPFYTVLTVVYNFVHYNEKYYKNIPQILHEVNKVYPKLNIIAAVPSKLSLNSKDFKDVQLVSLSTGYSEMAVWNKVINRVQTKYVYIGRNVIHFTWFDRLERLVREINNLNAVVVAAAFRTLRSGHWSNGCEQSVFRNYTLAYQYGYSVSAQECLLCHHVHGPFVTKTQLFKHISLDSSISATSAFAAFFLDIKKYGKMIVSCPDAMAFVTDESQQATSRADWKDLAYRNQIEKIMLNSGELFEFNCDEAKSHCHKVAGLALSHCCLKELADFVKLVLLKCEEGGMLCEIQEGTLIGTLKFNGILPWELDADLALHQNNYTAFAEKLKPYFTGMGYKWSSEEPRMHQIFSKNWKVELFTQKRMDTQLLKNQGISGTRINLDGEFVPTSESPGLMGRNRYGAEIYQHALHWSQTGKPSSWDFYGAKKFPPCKTPGHSGCLDQYIPDGNIMFKVPRP